MIEQRQHNRVFETTHIQQVDYMSREIRRVPADWQHPRKANGKYAAMSDDECRSGWAEGDATAYQIYETVSEGTPVSPVFTTTDEMYNWLRGQGYSETASRGFIEAGDAPSMAFIDGVMYENIHVFNAKGS